MKDMMSSNQMMIHRAIEMATVAHKEGTRKGTDIPYIVHPFEVALILQKNHAPDQVIVAGILHDVLEDTGVTEDELREEFGQEVLKLVLGASELLENRENTSWQDRKEHSVTYLKTAPLEVKLVSCADKLSNILSMIKDKEEEGDKLWERFNAGYESQKWYYRELLKSLSDLESYEMYRDFQGCVRQLFDLG